MRGYAIMIIFIHQKKARKVDVMQKNLPKIDMYKTGQNIKRIMLEQCMTVKDIQEYLGLAAPQSIYHWFDGRSLPTVDNLYVLSELFGMPIDMMVRGDRKENFYICERTAYGWLHAYYEKYLELRVG